MAAKRKSCVPCVSCFILFEHHLSKFENKLTLKFFKVYVIEIKRKIESTKPKSEICSLLLMVCSFSLKLKK